MTSRKKMIRNTGNRFSTQYPRPLNSGMSGLCFVFCRIGSNTSTIDGRIVMQASTPKSTPFAMTRPRSMPSV